jgi:hypothetical protein
MLLMLLPLRVAAATSTVRRTERRRTGENYMDLPSTARCACPTALSADRHCDAVDSLTTDSAPLSSAAAMTFCSFRTCCFPFLQARKTLLARLRAMASATALASDMSPMISSTCGGSTARAAVSSRTKAYTRVAGSRSRRALHTAEPHAPVAPKTIIEPLPMHISEDSGPCRSVLRAAGPRRSTRAPSAAAAGLPLSNAAQGASVARSRMRWPAFDMMMFVSVEPPRACCS